MYFEVYQTWTWGDGNCFLSILFSLEGCWCLSLNVLIFLGVVFDRKLSFNPHIKHLPDKCTKAINLLRVLAHTSWGADQETLLHDPNWIMAALFMDLLVALRPTCGCLILFKIMLFVCAWVLTELLPHLVYGGKKLSLQYCLKLSRNYNNPAYATVFNSKFHSVFERKPTQLPPLAIRVSGDLQAVGFKKSDVITY